MPEFIPTDLTGRTNEFTAVDESSEAKNEVDPKKPKDDISESINVETLLPLNNNLPVQINKRLTSMTDFCTFNSLSDKQMNEESNSSSDNAWQEVTILFVN